MNLLERLKKEVLVCDGAMGTEVAKANYRLEPGSPAEILNVESPGTILAIHRAYIAAGADIILTNTFSSNRMRLAESGIQNRLEEFITAGVAIAREAAGDSVFVLGDVGSTGRETTLPPVGTANEEDFIEVFSEQSRLLVEAGVDGIFIETISSLTEAVLAVKAARAATDIPILCSMTFKRAAESAPDNIRTFWGDDVDAIVTRLTDAGADVIGANCGELIEEMVRLTELFRDRTDLPIIIQTNAGRPALDENRSAVYPMTPAQMGALAKKIKAAGARIIGGCCGTGPEHIRAIREAINRKS